MKRLLATLAIVLFAAGVGADDVYRGLAKGSGELNDDHPPKPQVAGVQPGRGDIIDIYHGFGNGSGDLFQWQWTRTDKASYRLSSKATNIYSGFCGTSELMC